METLLDRRPCSQGLQHESRWTSGSGLLEQCQPGAATRALQLPLNQAQTFLKNPYLPGMVHLTVGVADE